MADAGSNGEKKQRTAAGRTVWVLGLALCIIFGFLLLCNIIIIVKGSIHPEEPPSVFGTTPMVVLSGSMSGDSEEHIEPGDLIFIEKTDTEDLEKGDVIAFMNEGSTTVVTHRIIEERWSDGERIFVTKGDANNAPDEETVPEDRVVGIYSSRIPKVGDFALFLHEPVGMVIFIGVPIVLFFIYDIVRRRKMARRQEKVTAGMEAEIERLRALADEKEDESPPER